MANPSEGKRIDRASRVIGASPATIYRAFLDPRALVQWLPPKGMTANIDAFDPREGGAYRMTLSYDEPDPSTPGKTSGGRDVVHGRFLELVPDERVVQVVEFESDHPAFSGAMTMTWSLRAAPGGTEVTIRCENVPEGIRPEEHDAGLRSSLSNLAALVE